MLKLLGVKVGEEHSSLEGRRSERGDSNVGIFG